MAKMKKTEPTFIPWAIVGEFDADQRIEIVTEDGEGIIVAEMEPHDGVNLDEWGPESIARAKGIAAVPVFTIALDAIRKRAYGASLEEAHLAILDIANIAEEALLIAERGK
jgi:hypothetical protein